VVAQRSTALATIRARSAVRLWRMCHPGRVADTNPSQRCGVGLFQFPVLLPASRKLIPKALLADSLGGLNEPACAGEAGLS